MPAPAQWSTPTNYAPTSSTETLWAEPIEPLSTAPLGLGTARLDEQEITAPNVPGAGRPEVPRADPGEDPADQRGGHSAVEHVPGLLAAGTDEIEISGLDTPGIAGNQPGVPPPEPAESNVAEVGGQPEWVGVFTPFEVGDPGRAPNEVTPLPDPGSWHRRDSVFDGFTILGGDGTALADVRAASLRGVSHRAYARTRQDEYAFQVTPDGRYLVLCVADGLSSGRRSHHAAEVACRTGVALLVDALSQISPDRLDWDRVVGEVAGHIIAFARKRLPGGEDLDVGGVVGWMATTATYAVVDLTDEVLAVHTISVGDSSAWVLSATGWHPLNEVKNADVEVHSSAVGALPVVPSWPIQVHHTRVAPGEVLVLMTDGVGDPLYKGLGDVGRFLAYSWRTPPTDLAFAAHVGFHKRSYDDDRTAIAVWPRTRG